MTCRGVTRPKGASVVIASPVPLQRRLDPLDRPLGVLPLPERGEPDVPLAARAEARAGRRHDVRLAEEPVEEVPRGRPARRLRPDVRCVRATEAAEPGL